MVALLHLGKKMDYLAINKRSWDKRAQLHLTSDFYDVPSFLNGKSTLNEIETNDLGDVRNKSLLHLQCHFGLDTLSWARLGAKVTGVDLSSSAIEQARNLAAKSQLSAEFICEDVYQFGDNNNKQYDIVFTSYGVLCWLPDIDKWAQTVTKSLKSGGTFYIAEFHPFYDAFSGYSYFHSEQPDIEQEATYTENSQGDTSTIVTWTHPLSSVINALIKVGIEIQQLNEYPFSPYNCFDNMREEKPGQFSILYKDKSIPLLYTIKGIKS